MRQSIGKLSIDNAFNLGIGQGLKNRVNNGGLWTE